MNTSTIRFSRKDSAQFFKTLNKRVNEYFNENNLKKTGNWKLHLKTIVMFAIFLTPYFLILTLHLPFWAYLLLFFHPCRPIGPNCGRKYASVRLF